MKPDVKKIIADIKATKGNRKFCNGLAGTLQDDNYVSSICKYVKTVTPERIDLLIDYVENLEVKVLDTAEQLANAESKCRELAAENAGLKSNLMYWNSEDAEPAKSPLDIAHESSFGEGVEFDVHVAARMPSMTYRVVRRTTYSTEIELVRGGIPETPVTDTFLAEVRASELDSLAGVAETMLVKFSNQSCSSDMHEVVGWKMVLQQATNHAAQLRKGAAL